MNPSERLADLMVEELKTLIRQTVQEAVADVIVEFAIVAERDAELMAQAELTGLLRDSLHSRLADLPTPFVDSLHSDD